MKRRIIAALLLAGVLLTACGGESETENGTQQSTEQSEEMADFTLVKDGTAVYRVVRTAEAGKKSADMMLALNDRVEEITGKYLPVANDVGLSGEANPETEYEILVGDTNRKESIDAKAQLLPYTFAIRFVGSKIVIVGDNESLLCAGLQYFISNYLAAGKTEGAEGSLRLLNTEDYVSVSSVESFAQLVSSDTEHESEAKAVYTVPRPNGSIKTVQGGCLVGKYFYQAFLQKDAASDEQNNIVRIVKYDTEQKKVAKESADLALNHANDITYNSKLDTLVVVHNNPNRKQISFLDPETLEITDTKTIDYKIYCIDYHAKTDTYVIGLSGGQTFRLLDADFKPIGDVFQPTELTQGYTTQGCAIDDNYIYFVLYNKNVITVYNHQGEFVTLIKLDVGAIEPENISVAGDKIYVGCAGNGCKVFDVALLMPQEQ